MLQRDPAFGWLYRLSCDTCGRHFPLFEADGPMAARDYGKIYGWDARIGQHDICAKCLAEASSPGSAVPGNEAGQSHNLPRE